MPEIRRVRFAAVLLLPLLWTAPGMGAEQESCQWLTGDAFQSKLALPATVLWAGSPLRENLYDFARTQQIAVLLDRRVDPDQKLSLTVREEPVLEVLRKLAVVQDLRASVVRDIVYVGPPASARRIRTAAELRRLEIDELGPPASQRFGKLARLSWRDFETPREVLDDLAKENDIEVLHLDRVPHDLWPAGDLPSLSLIERLTLILHQFDLTFQVAPDARRVAVVPLPAEFGVVRDYAVGRSAESLADQWRKDLPEADVRIAGNRIFVRGLVEDHEKIDQWLHPASNPVERSGEKKASKGSATQVFTAEVPNQPLGAVLKHFAAQLGLELRVDETSLRQAGVSLEQRISFRVENATFDELFQAVLQPVGCEHQRQGNVLKVWARR